jgi:hypothetical protein
VPEQRRSLGVALGCIALIECAPRCLFHQQQRWRCSVRANIPCTLCAMLQVARLLLYKEYWYGTADSTSSGSKRLQLLPAHSFDVPVTQLSRPQPTAMGGTWNVFVMAANPAVEENPNTLQVGGGT